MRSVDAAHQTAGRLSELNHAVRIDLGRAERQQFGGDVTHDGVEPCERDRIGTPKLNALGIACGVIVTVGRIFPGTGLATGASRVRLLATNMLPTALLVWQLSPSIVPLRTKPSSATQSRECA
jgi:hypothetical protein